MRVNSTLLLLNALFISLAVLSCGNGGSDSKKEEPKNLSREELMELNQSRSRVEERRIKKYIERRGRDYQSSGTGLRYSIYEHGDSAAPKAEEGQIAVMEFTVRLLNGDTAYSSRPGKPGEFLIGMDHVESGLHEGITYLRPGDKAELIMPPHLAHGLVGDLNEIPMNATIIYDIHLLEVK